MLDDPARCNVSSSTLNRGVEIETMRYERFERALGQGIRGAVGQGCELLKILLESGCELDCHRETIGLGRCKVKQRG